MGFPKCLMRHKPHQKKGMPSAGHSYEKFLKIQVFIHILAFQTFSIPALKLAETG